MPSRYSVSNADVYCPSLTKHSWFWLTPNRVSSLRRQYQLEVSCLRSHTNDSFDPFYRVSMYYNSLSSSIANTLHVCSKLSSPSPDQHAMRIKWTETNQKESVGNIRRTSCYIKHGHSVRGFEWVVWYANGTSRGSWHPRRVSKTKCNLVSTRISYVLCTSFSFLGRCTNGPRQGNFYRVCDEKMLNPLLVLTLLKIISDINDVSVHQFRILIDSI